MSGKERGQNILGGYTYPLDASSDPGSFFTGDNRSADVTESKGEDRVRQLLKALSSCIRRSAGGNCRRGSTRTTS